MPSDAYYKDKTPDEILAELYGTAQPGSPVHEQQKMAIFVGLAKGLTDANTRLAKVTEEASRQSTRLQARIIWLTVVLALATVVLAGVALAALLRPQ